MSTLTQSNPSPGIVHSFCFLDAIASAAHENEIGFVGVPVLQDFPEKYFEHIQLLEWPEATGHHVVKYPAHKKLMQL